MSTRTAGLLAALIAALMLLVGILTGCAGSTPAAGGFDIPVFYLYPGEPAPVEGPQLRTSDFEMILDELTGRQEDRAQN